MLSIEEKIQQRLSFINSDKFGIDTFQTLFMFKVNSFGMMSNIKLVGTLIEKIDNGELIEHTLTPRALVQSQQFFTLDCISKLISIIEGLFVLIHSLNDGYNSVSKTMMSYKTGLLWTIFENIKSKNYDMRKILAYPSIDTLDIPVDKKPELSQIYSDCSEIIYEALEKLIEFYSKFNIVHNKSKHGLSLEPVAVRQESENLHFFETSLVALEHRDNPNKMPPGSFTSEGDITDTDNLWFNVESRINFTKELFSEMAIVMSNLETICDDFVENNLQFANNCGDSYFPILRMSPHQVIPRLLSKGHRTSTSLDYLGKIISNMTDNEFKLKTNRKYRGILAEAVSKNTITNIFIKPRTFTNDQ